MQKLTHKEFVEKYKSGSLTVLIDDMKAGDFVLSQYASKYNKPAHQFWTWTGLILTFIVPLGLLAVHWVLSLLCAGIGYAIIKSARKSAQEFVLENMLEDEIFWAYVLIYDGAIIKDKNGQVVNLKENLISQVKEDLEVTRESEKLKINSKKEKFMDKGKHAKILQAFAEHIKKYPVPIMIRDSKLLPYPKEEMLTAGLLAYQAETNPVLRKGISVGIISLAFYQDNIGDQPNSDMSVSNEEMAKLIQETEKQVGPKILEKIEKERKLIKASLDEIDNKKKAA